jgi:glycosyltransferase involved in cell wall biosynthesis
VKKILFVIPTLRDGGAERSLVNLLTELPPEKYDIDLLLFKMQGTFLSQIPQNVHIIKQPPILKKLYGSVKEAGIYMPVKVFGNVISKILKNGMGEQKAFLWEYFYKKVIDGIDKEYDVAVGYLGGESTYYIVDKVKAKRKIHWVHNDYRTSGMPKKYDLKLFPRVDAIVTEFKPKEYIGVENVLLSVGRLSEQKGFDMAISAASKLKKQQINFKWFIIGSGPLESKLKNQIKKEKVEDYVVLIGTKENPYPYIKNCDLFVQPSRYEGKSVVIDEAKILAKPIVATAYPTVRDQIRNANEGVIVELSVDGIYKGLKEMVFDKTKQKEISNYLENHEYGNQTEIKKYIKLIEGE